MEIIHLILGKANPERMNGVNKVVFQLATQQSNSGRNVSVWGITKNPSHDYGVRNFKTLLFQSHSNIFKIDKSLSDAISELKNRDVTFHIHGGWIPTFYTISKLLSKYRIPYVFTPHGAYNTIAMKKSKWIKKMYFQLFEKQLIQKASVIHCIGKSEVIGIEKMVKNPKTQLMPYGFELNCLPSEREHNTGDPFVIGFIGRLDIYTKGLDLLLDGFKLFLQQNRNSKLWIVGDSDQRSKLEQMITSRKLQNDVVLWGSKFGKEKENLLKKMDVFAHPSRNEGLPSSVLEAASYGIPCLVSEATNVGEYIEKYNCGISVPNENHFKINEALSLLNEKRNNGQLEMIGDSAIEMVQQEFNWNHIVNRFDQLYAAQ